MLTKSIKKEIMTYLDSDALNLLANLKGRWDCEKEYEDWNDYAEKMKESIPSSWKFVKATKRPFGFHAKIESLKVSFFLKPKGRYVTLSAKVVR